MRELIKRNKIRSVRDFHNISCCNNCGKCYKEVKSIIEKTYEQDIYEESRI